MKTAQSKYILLITIVALALNVYGKERIEKEKKIYKRFEITSSDRISIKNSFGKVHINTSAKNEITVNVNIKVKKGSEQKAQQLLDNINIDIDKAPGLVSFRTEIAGPHNNKDGESFEINYEVNMPKNNPLYVSNSFGPTYLADFDGELDISSAYGSIKMDNINGSKTNVGVSFGSANITYIKTGSVDISYSDATIERAGNISLNNAFSNTRIGKVGDLKLKCKYGDVKLEEVNRIEGYTGFSGFKIQKLNNYIKLESEYGSDFNISEITPGFELIDIELRFGNINLELPETITSNFEVKVEYGEFHYDKERILFKEIIKDKQNASYKGTLGKGNSNSRIVIDASYSNVRF